MVKLVRKFVTDIKLSKLNAVKYSGILAFLIFGTSVTYQNLIGKPVKDSIIIAGITALVLFVALYFMCFAIVKQIDKQDAKIQAEKQKELEERRRRLEERSNNKINNKKKNRKSKYINS